jgi:hypothetical protein
MEAAACGKSAAGHTYARREPETSLLYRTLQTSWLGFVAELEAEGGELPAFVREEFEAYLRCGILAHGLLRVRWRSSCCWPRPSQTQSGTSRKCRRCLAPGTVVLLCHV